MKTTTYSEALFSNSLFVVLFSLFWCSFLAGKYKFGNDHFFFSQDISEQLVTCSCVYQLNWTI